MLIAGSILAILLLALGGWLTTQHALWWIAEFILITSTILFVAIAFVMSMILKRFSPPQTKEQQQAVRDFSDKLQRVADTVGISRFTLLFRIVRDVIRPPEQSFVQQIADDSTTLHTDFIKLQRQFKVEKDI